MPTSIATPQVFKSEEQIAPKPTEPWHEHFVGQLQAINDEMDRFIAGDEQKRWHRSSPTPATIAFAMPMITLPAWCMGRFPLLGTQPLRYLLP